MPAKISRTDFPRTLIGRRHGGWKDDGHGNRVKFFLFEGTSTNHISSQMSRMHLQSQLTLFLCRKWPLFTLLWHLQGGFRFFWISRPSKAELTVPLVPPMQWWSAPRWVQPAATWAAKPMIAEKKTAQASGVGKWEMWWWWLWWCMGCFFFFFPHDHGVIFEMECGTAVASCLKRAFWQELQQLGISIFNRTSRSLGKMVHLEPLHDSESSSYIKLPWWNSERSSCSLAMSWLWHVSYCVFHFRGLCRGVLAMVWHSLWPWALWGTFRWKSTTSL